MWDNAFNRFIRIPIRTQLLVVILLMMLPVAALLIHTAVDLRNDAIRAAHLSTLELTNSIANETEQLVAGAQQLASTLAQLPEVQNKDAETLQPLLARILRLNSQYANVSVIDRHGMTWASAVPMAAPFSVADRRYFRNAAATGRFSSGEYAIGKITGKPILSFAHPLSTRQGRFDGVIAISFDLDHFRHLPVRSKYPAGTSIALLDHTGTILARTLDNDRFMGKPFKADVFARIVSLPDESSLKAFGVDNVERFSSHRKLRLRGETAPYLYIRAGIPVVGVLDDIFRNLLMVAGIATVALAAGFALVWLIVRRSIVDRVKALELACQRLADGDLSVRTADVVFGGELGRLGSMFDTMAQRLADREGDMKQHERELLASRAMLQELNRRLETAREQERTHIAREIHDVMGQTLTALKLDMAWLSRQLPPAATEAAARSEEMLTQLDSAIGVVQAITAELSPPLLELGLAAAIEWHGREFERRSGVNCLMMLDETSCRGIGCEDETMLFRVYQEAMTNVIRHSGASEVSISLCATASSVILEIADNGRGIAEDAISSPASFGLHGMRERAAICGAAFSIKGTPGTGTIVKLELPQKRR